MKLTIHFKEISEKEKLWLENQEQKNYLRIFRNGSEVILQAEGSYNEMLKIIIITSYLSHTELTLRK